jgi:hypothetical protein
LWRSAGEAIADQAKPGLLKNVVLGGLSEGFFEELPQSLQEKVFENAALGKPLNEGLDKAGTLGPASGFAKRDDDRQRGRSFGRG